MRGGIVLKIMRRAVTPVIVLLAVTLLLRFIVGYGFTPRSTLGSMPIHGKDARVFDELNFGWAHVYLVKTNSGYETAIVQRYGLLWHLKGTAVLQQSSAPIQTVGWASVYGSTHQLAVFAVETTDPQVKFVEVGPPSNVKKKTVSPGHPVVFSWDNISFVSGDYKAIALSGSGKELYYFGYPRNTGGAVNSSEWTWHPES